MSELRRRLRGLSPARIADLAEGLRRSAAAPNQATAPALSSAQRRIWFADRAVGGSAAFNNAVALWIDGALDLDRLQGALNDVVFRHEILRTSYAVVDGRCVPRVDSPSVVIERRDLADVPAAMVDEALCAAAARPFDLERGPVLRALALTLGPERHVVGLTVHHIAFDAWSRQIFLDDLAAAYRSRGGEQIALEPVEGYSAYIARTEKEPTPVRREALERYWRGVVADLPPSPLAGIARLAGGEDERARTEGVAIPPDVWRRVEEASRAQRSTPFVVALAAFSLVLERLSGQDDVAIITSVAARERSESVAVAGNLVDTLLLRIRVGGDTTSDLLQRTADATREALAHRDLSFDRVVALAARPLEARAHPLSPIAFVLDLASPTALMLTGARVDVRSVPAGHSAFDLCVVLRRDGDGAHADAEYRIAALDAAAVRAALRAFVHVLGALSGPPGRPLADVALMSNDERRRLATLSAGPEVPPLAEGDVAARFTAIATRHTGAVALRVGAEELRYGELLAQASRLAHHLRALGADRGALVAVALPRGLDLFIALVSALLSGACFVALDVNLPWGRLAAIIDQTVPALVVTDAARAAQIAVPAWVPLVVLDEEQAARAAASPAPPELVIDGVEPAYRIYTSGSTGKPKAIDVSHDAMLRLVRWQAAYFGVGPGCIVSQLSTPSFDAIIGEMCMSLLSGATLAVVPDAARTPEGFSRFLVEERVTVAVVVPSFLAQMAPDAIPPEPERWLVVVGEPFAATLAAPWLGRRRVVNAYGPAEYTVYATAMELDRAEIAGAGETLAIGRPIDGTRAYVLGSGGEPVPCGVPGELFLAGPGIALGYVGAPAATADRFTPDPFAHLLPPVVDLIDAEATAAIEAFVRHPRGAAIDAVAIRRNALAPSSLDAQRAALPPDLAARTAELAAGLDGEAERHGFFRYLIEGARDLVHGCGLVSSVLERLLGGPLRGRRGIDLGCGGGEVLDVLTGAGAEVIGVDLGPWQVHRARTRGHRVVQARIDVAPGRFLSDLGIAAATLDFAVATLVFDRVADPGRFLENLMVVLRPGGRFALQLLLPNVPFDAGVSPSLVYTDPARRCVTGGDAEAQMAELAARLRAHGAIDVAGFRLPYAMETSDGVEHMMLWSITGVASGAAATRDGARMYRTGDLVVMREDGALVFRGRVDAQIKIQGARLEPGEIEAVLASHPEVAHAAVAVRVPEPGGAPILAAWCLPRGPVAGRAGEAELEERIRAACARRLPPWMVPQAIVIVAELPRGASGKLNHASLVLPPRVRPPRVEPRTELEGLLCHAWSEVLGKPLGIDDSIFDLGADSIAVVRVSARLQAEGLRLEVSDCFEAPTVRRLAERVDAMKGRTPAAGSAKTTPIQRWLMEWTGEIPTWSIQWTAVALAASVDLERLALAAAKVVRAHDALRTSVARDRIEVLDVGHPVAFSLAHSREHACAIAAGAVDARAGRMLAGSVVPGSGELVLVASHFAIDAVSWGTLCADLVAAYEGRPVPPPATTHVDAARALDAYASDEACVAEAKHWCEQVAAAGTLSPPLPVIDVATGNLDAATTVRLVELAARLEATPLSLVLAAVARVVAAATGTTSLRIDIEGNGRALPGLDLSRTIGWFTALYPVAVAVDPARGRVDQARDCVHALRMVPNGGIGYQVLADRSADAALRTQLRTSRAFAVVNYLGRITPPIPAGGPIQGILDLGGATPPGSVPAPHPVAVDAWLDADGKLRWRVSRAGDAPFDSAKTLLALLQDELCALAAEAEDLPRFRFGLVSRAIPLASLVDAVREADVIDVLPLTPMQRGMLFHVRAAPGSGVYENQMTFRLRGGLNPMRWQAAWQAVLDRHRALRTGFVHDALAEPLQLVHRAVAGSVALLDLRDRPLDSRAAGAEAHALREREASFDLERPPLARMSVIRLDDDVWQVVWTFHHLVADGWAVAAIVEDLLDVYAGRTASHVGSDDGFKQLLANQVSERPGRPSRDATRAYWARIFAGGVPSDPLGLGPVGNPGALARGSGEVTLTLSADETARAVAAARRRGVTLGIYVQAAWALILARHARRAEVAYGLTVSGRSEDILSIDRSVGLFVNTVPVRVRVAGQTRTEAFLQDLQQQAIERRPFEGAALADVHRWCGIHPPESIFNNVVLIENFPISSAICALPDGLRVEETRCRQRSHYPVTLVIVPGERMELQLAWEPARLGEPRARAILAQMRAAILGLADDGCARLDDINLAGGDAIGGASMARAGAYVGSTIHAAFEARAARRPGDVALIEDRRRVSYAELDAWANRVAAALSASGVAPETAVGIFAPRSIEAVVGILATLKVGAAWVPLDPTYPPRRIAQMLEASRPGVVLTRTDVVARLPETGTRTLDVAKLMLGEHAPFVSQDVPPDALAYILFTSGSTGAPKGVLGTHRATLAVTAWRDEAFPYAEGERCAQKTPLSFGDSIQEIIAPLLAGVPLAILSEGALRDLRLLVDELAEHRVTRLIIVPSLLAALLRSRAPVERLGAISLWIASGEALPVDVVQRFRERLPGARLVNLYGASEVACDNTWIDITDTSRRPPIGRPVAGSSIQLLDERMRPVPAGGIGPIYVGGEVVNRGYLDDPRQTADAFLPDPAGGGGRVFRTGDLGCFEDGEVLSYLGRADQQIILRGVRVEVAEIEAALDRCPGVAASGVVHDEQVRGLVAFVTPTEREALIRAGRLHVLPGGLALFENQRSETDYLAAEMLGAGGGIPPLPDGAVVVDIGANIGLFSVLAHHAAEGVRIVAIEPVPDIVRLLKENLAMHGCEAQVLACAVGDAPGRARFTFYPNASLESGLFADPALDEQIFRAAADGVTGAAGEHLAEVELARLAAGRFTGRDLNVEIVTISSIIERLGLNRIHLLKIDVERAELAALRGIAARDWPRIDRVMAELEDRDGVRDTVSALFPPEFEVRWTRHRFLASVDMWMLDAVRRTAPPVPARFPRTPRPPPRAELSERRLRARIAAELPAHMLPARICVVDALPRTPSGKLDRKALAAISIPPATESAILDPLADRIRSVWCQVLHCDGIGVHDNFFDVGGHSLLMLEVFDHLIPIVERDLTVADLYQHPTISALAAFLRDRPGGQTAAEPGAERGARRRERQRGRRGAGPPSGGDRGE